MYKKVHLRLNLRVHFKIELPFKLHMLMHLLVCKSAKNNSMKGELKGSNLLHWKVHLTFSFRKHLKLHKNVKKKIHLML